MRYQFFVCLLVRRYRIDARAAAAGLLRTTLRFKNRFLSCVTNRLVNTRAGRRIAQAALNLCGSLEQRRDLGTCPTFISLNAKLVACRTSTPIGSRSHENRRRLDGALLRGVERRAGVHARLSRRLAPRQERANNRANRHRIRSLVQSAAWTNRTPSLIKSTQSGNSSTSHTLT